MNDVQFLSIFKRIKNRNKFISTLLVKKNYSSEIRHLFHIFCFNLKVLFVRIIPQCTRPMPFSFSINSSEAFRVRPFEYVADQKNV